MNEYATVAELKATLELSGESFADPDLTLALSAASRAVEAVTCRRFWIDANTSSIRYYTPDSCKRVWIDDLVTLTEFAVDATLTGTFTAWTQTTDFYLEPLNAASDVPAQPYTSVRVAPFSTRYLMPDYPRSVRVTGKFGWSAVPDEVKQATKMIAARLAKRSREAPFGVVGFGADGTAVRIATNDPDINMLLGPLQRTNLRDGVIY